MSKHISFAGTVLVCALCAPEAGAGFLVQNFVGKSGEGSSIDVVPIAVGTPIEIHTTFDSTPFSTDTGFGEFHVTDILLVIDGISYHPLDPELYIVELEDPRSADAYLSRLTSPELGTTSSLTFGAVYSNTTPPLDATAPIPTVFGGYQGQAFDQEVAFVAGDAVLTLTFENDDSLKASITGAGAVPEPATFVSAGIAGLVGLAVVARPRRRAA